MTTITAASTAKAPGKTTRRLQAERWAEDVDTLTLRLLPVVEEALDEVAARFGVLVASAEPIDTYDVATVTQLWQEAAPELLELLAQVYTGSANQMLRRLNPGQLTTQTLREAYLSTASNRLTAVGDDLWNEARQALAAGTREGEGYRELRQRLQDAFKAGGTELGPSRALRIARTEVQAAVNRGTQDAVQSLPPERRPGFKTWLAADDSRTRPAHASADNQTVAVDEPFMVGGELLMYPGDPAGSAATTVNCRCAVAYLDAPGGRALAHDLCRPPVTRLAAAASGTDDGEACAILDDPSLQTVAGPNQPTPGWAATMSEREAADWARGSVIQDTMWHGTPSAANANTIMSAGFDDLRIGVGSGNQGYYGRGLYFSGDRDYARTYAFAGSDGQVLGSKVNVQNPWMTEIGDVDSTDGLWAYAQSADAGAIGTTTLADALTVEAKRRGHDAIAITKNGEIVELVLFDKTQVTVFTRGGPFDA